MTIVAKMGNKIVEIVKIVQDVKFSPDKGWVLVDPELGAPDMTGSTRANIKWYPATTRFEWIRSFNFR